MADETLMLDVKEFGRAIKDSGPITAAMVMDLIMVLWFPAKQPLVIDDEQIVETLNKFFPRRDYTVELFRTHKAEIKQFFVELPDGRWVPAPRFFSVTDPLESGNG